MTYYLAIDIGASSGRHILGWMEDGVLHTEEIYRFENNLKRREDALVWDLDNLVTQVKLGIRKCKTIGKLPQTVAIDTWGVDYVLLDAQKQELLPVYCYRDSRTAEIVPKVEEIISAGELYARTGIQKQNFNTIYQLYCDKHSGKLEQAKYFLMMPAYLSYCLTGKIANEYTNATSTGLVNAKTYTWDARILDELGISAELLGELSMPGDTIGGFTKEMQDFAGFDAEVVFCPSHDTASAVAACPLKEEGLYISSGTWSLFGTELLTPILSENARLANFTNEGGIAHRFRFLKNYMGMWLFQNIRRDLNKSMTYDEMMEAAMTSGSYHYIDVNAPGFVAPENMIQAIRDYLKMPELPLDVLLNSVYHSLAKSYGDAAEEIERLAGISAPAIHIVGGGCQDSYLNRLTAEYTGKKVYAGPVEATALGNLIAQILVVNPDYTLEKARTLIRTSFHIEEVK